jgi:hypothetical protein
MMATRRWLIGQYDATGKAKKLYTSGKTVALTILRTALLPRSACRPSLLTQGQNIHYGVEREKERERAAHLDTSSAQRRDDPAQVTQHQPTNILLGAIWKGSFWCYLRPSVSGPNVTRPRAK